MVASKIQYHPCWTHDVPLPSPQALAADTFADVCIVGAGIAGLSTAYMLLRAGKSVVVLDDGPISGGQTAYTTAHLANAIDDRYTEIIRIHGEDGARLAADSHSAAIDRIEDIVLTEQIDCDFHRLDGFLFAPPDDSSGIIDRELESARKAGVLVERLSRAPLQFDTGPCLRFHRQGQFHPLKYTTALAKVIQRDGGRLFSNTHATTIHGGTDAHVETKAGPIVQARAVVVATNSPVNDVLAIHTKQAPYMTYVIGAEIRAGSVPRALYWDTADPYHYIRMQRPAEAANGNEVLIVGGEDHKSGQADDGMDRWQRLEHWARERFPNMGSVLFRWSGQVMETVDGLAFIGRNPGDRENVFIATGDSGMGMTHGTIAGMLLADLILGRKNPWTDLYDPARKPLGAAGEFLRENLNVAVQYGARITPGEVSSPDEVGMGDGAIMRMGMTKVAVHRRDDGSLCTCSAICPHLGCVVAWNSSEQTWDCPCHGSRFTAEGHVLNGPANSDLEPVTVEAPGQPV